MKRIMPFMLLLAALVVPDGIFAQRKVTVKLASPVPENTPWGAALNRMSSEWDRVSNGNVELRVYHGGVAGAEEDVLRKLKMNQIQGAVFTSFGLNLITPEIITLSVPFLIRNDRELEVVLRALKPELEAKINEKGFYTLAWAKSGWVKIFSKAPVFVPADLKRQKVGTSPEAPEITQVFKSMGYQMVPITNADVLVSLNSGMVEAVYQSPVFIGGMQIFGITKHMASINLAPFMGGIILNQQAWQRIPDAYKAPITAVSQKIAAEIDASISRLETEAVRSMITYGLTVNQVSEEQAALWYGDMEKAMPTLLRTTFDQTIYRKIETILREHRSK
ncbi:MAG: TRAP transporter substrate-binding protein DctP [Spirochaetaceae bacterium]|jgi:TRAP-type C4-dicarboxylate transport system substrate-binding protein|nr:TRAP transporter substrate-binding protein DctP [Spirochaetaceae bacterium]